MKKALKYTLIGIAVTLGVLTAIGLAGALAGAGDSKEPATHVAQTPAAKPAAQTPTPKPAAKTTGPGVSKEAVYLAVMRKEYPQLKKTDNKVLLDAAHGVCNMYDKGYSFVQIGYTAIDSGMTAEQAGYLIGASTSVFCPQYSGEVN